MEGRRKRSTLRPIGEMNLTPMMDLTFLLLITFIITFPLIEQGIPVKLPAGKAQDLGPQAKSIAITIDKEGRIFMDSVIVDAETLEQRLSEEHGNNPELKVLIRGDESANYGSVVTVLKIVHDLKITKMALVTKEQ